MSKIVFLFIFIFSSGLYAQDCVIEDQLSNLFTARCSQYTGQNEVYSENGATIKVIKQLGDTLVLDPGEHQITAGEKLSFTKKVIVQAPAPIVQKIVMEQEKFFKIYMSALSYGRAEINSKLGPLKVDYETVSNTFKTLPLDIEIQLTTDDFGFLVSPDFDNSSGELAFYRRLDAFGIGLFGELDRQKRNEKITLSNGSSITGEGLYTSYSFGLIMRLQAEQDKGEFLANLRLGYTKIENSSGNLAKMDAFYGQVDAAVYYKINKHFQLGAGLELSYGRGTLEIDTGTEIISDDANAFSFALSPIKMLMLF